MTSSASSLAPSFAPSFAQRLRRRFYGSRMHHARLRRHPFGGRRGAPPDPVGGDAALAAPVMDGDFRLFGRLKHLGDTPWNAPHINDGERALLHDFYFLDDLRAEGSDDARGKARDLVMRWITGHGKWREISWRADVLGARTAAWLRGFDFVTAGAPDGGVIESMEESLRMQAAHMPRAVRDVGGEAPSFNAVEGLLAAGVAMRGYEALIDDGLKLLERALDAHILADGCHISRSPALHMAALEPLLRIRAVLDAGQIPPPKRLTEAPETMAAALRVMMLGDGGFARLNGGLEGDAARIQHVLKTAGPRSGTPGYLPDGGLQRLQRGQTAAVMDTGGAFETARRPGGHAGLFAFEFSHKKHRLIVNCGGHPDPNAAWRESLRASAAHSTLVIDDTNAAPLTPEGAPLPAADTQVTVRRSEHEDSLFVQAVHHGYRRAYGLSAEREIYISAAGDDIRGQDMLSPDAEDVKTPPLKTAGQAAVRFHLHPDVDAAPVADGGFYLRAGPSVWRFRFSGADAGVDAGVEESVYMADNGEVRKTSQIVLRIPLEPGRTAGVKWSFKLEPPA
ncbi:MAG: heparinase II/III family protein [Rhodospirillales bacterium]